MKRNDESEMTSALASPDTAVPLAATVPSPTGMPVAAREMIDPGKLPVACTCA